eukprot:9477791-Pyramimonas_sp.AAC.1
MLSEFAVARAATTTGAAAVGPPEPSQLLAARRPRRVLERYLGLGSGVRIGFEFSERACVFSDRRLSVLSGARFRSGIGIGKQVLLMVRVARPTGRLSTLGAMRLCQLTWAGQASFRKWSIDPKMYYAIRDVEVTMDMVKCCGELVQSRAFPNGEVYIAYGEFNA